MPFRWVGVVSIWKGVTSMGRAHPPVCYRHFFNIKKELAIVVATKSWSYFSYLTLHTFPMAFKILNNILPTILFNSHLYFTGRSQQVKRLCQRLYYYQILTAVNKLKDYVRGCTTTKYWPQSTNWRIMSEVVLLPNTDHSLQLEGLCQRLYYY